jgi:hypothetical protein
MFKMSSVIYDSAKSFTLKLNTLYLLSIHNIRLHDNHLKVIMTYLNTLVW